MFNLSTFNIPGYSPKGAFAPEEMKDSSDTTPAPSYKIPPVVWMVLFLIVGYIGLSFMVEE
jgi:hypothetical protein